LVDDKGTLKSYPGAIDAAGDLSIPKVPMAPYLLALTSPPPKNIPAAQPAVSFFATSSRTLDLGTTYSGRPNPAGMTKPTFLSLQAMLTLPFNVYTEDGMGTVLQPLDDRLQFISKNGSVTGIFDPLQSMPGDNAPADGDKQLSGWKINAQDAFSLLGFL